MPTWLLTAFSTVAGVPSLIAAALTAWMQRDKEMNTQPMQDSAMTQQDAALKTKFTQDQIKGNIDEIRKTDSH